MDETLVLGDALEDPGHQLALELASLVRVHATAEAIPDHRRNERQWTNCYLCHFSEPPTGPRASRGSETATFPSYSGGSR
jgi:hypothetical protein